MAGDMNKAIPEGFDVIMFWNIGYIDSRVMRLAYDSLPDGGMIVRSCSSWRRSKKPSPTAFVHGYLSVQPKQQTKAEKMQALKDAGFRSLEYRRISPHLGFITGLKKSSR